MATTKVASLVAFLVIRKHDDVNPVKTVESSAHQIPVPSLVGKWFHTLNDEGVIQYRGQVLREEGARCFVQFYSFMDGNPSTQRCLTPKEFDSARFYDSNQAMLEAYRRAYPELRDELRFDDE